MNEVTRGVLSLLCIVLIAISLVAAVYLTAPTLKHDEQLTLPRSLDDAKALGRLLSRYTDAYYTTVLVGVAVTYIVLQSFAVPGSIFLSILCGYLFSFPVALLLICTCSACGALVCYLLSHLIGRQLVNRYMPERVEKWREQVEGQRSNLFNYILFLRITPFLPNWFINIASPVIDVPVLPFFLGTFFGVAPPSFLFVQMGQTLQTLTSTTPQLSYTTVGLMVAFALGSLLPVLCRRQLKDKMT